jgi:hypothetical protein
MASTKTIKLPSRKDLILFALLLPVFTAGLGWMSVRRPSGLWVALIMVSAAAVIGIALNAKKWKKSAWALFIPVTLVAFLMLGRTGATAVSLAGAWALVGALLGAVVALTPAGKPIYAFWIEAAEPIGFVLSTVLLGLTFYLVFTPIGLLMRIFGRDSMRLKLDRAATSYWVTHEAVTDPDRYFRQF